MENVISSNTVHSDQKGERKIDAENAPPTSSKALHEIQSPTPSNQPRRKRYKVQAVKRYKRPSSMIHKKCGDQADPVEDGKDDLVAGSTIIAQEDDCVARGYDQGLERFNSQALTGQFVESTPTQETPELTPPSQTIPSHLKSPFSKSQSTLSAHQLPVQREQHHSSRKRNRRSYEVSMDICSTEGVVKINHTKQGALENKLGTGIMAVIRYAARMVASELRKGSWDYAYRADVANEDQETTSSSEWSKKERSSHLIMAAASIEKFAYDVIVPSFIAKGASDTSSTSLGKTSPNHRVFVGALLALRELLIMNADKIFRGSHRKQEQNDTESTQQKEERLFRTKLLCTALISNSILILDASIAEDVIASFESALQGYDNGEEEFSSCLTPTDHTLKCVLSNGTKLKEMESLSWRVSYNYARSIHPLIQLKKDRDVLLACRKRFHESKSSSQIRSPSSNLCFVPMIERVKFESDWSEFPELMKDDIPDNVVLDFHRKELMRIRSMQKRRGQHEA